MRTRAEIEAAQWRALSELLARIPRESFYGRKFANVPRAESLRDLRRLPFTQKAELSEDQRTSAPFGTTLLRPINDYTRFHQTSGTTAAPLRWLDTPESWNALVDCWADVFRAAGVTSADRVFFAFSYGPFLGFWLAFSAAERIGCLCLPGGGMSSAARLRLMLDARATVLCCTPTYAARLAEVAAEEKIDLRTLAIRRLMVAGEPGGSLPAVRARLEELWPNAKVFDHHGMTEVGPVTYECPASPGRLHVTEHAFIAEIVDAQDQPVRAGETGELILTTLARKDSPLIRYRTGDLVRKGPDAICECGRAELRLDGGILGRVDDMVLIRGVNIFPSAVEEIVRGFPEVAEYRAFVRGAELELEIESENSEVTRKIQHALQTAFNLRVPVKLAKEPLPRAEMKAKRWLKVS